MATLKNDFCSLRIRRTADGLNVQVKTSPTLEDVLSRIGRKEVHYLPNSNDERKYYYCRTRNIEDNELLPIVLGVGSSKDNGIDVTVQLPRTRDQLRAFAEQIRDWFSTVYEQHVKPVDYTVSITARCQ